jgi:hypothetical protein
MSDEKQEYLRRCSAKQQRRQGCFRSDTYLFFNLRKIQYIDFVFHLKEEAFRRSK